MKNINRIFQDKISQTQKDGIKADLKAYILKFTHPIQIYFYGSILREEFDAYSDVDVLIIYEDKSMATESIRALQRNRRDLKIDMPIEFVCVSKAEFEKKSENGGLFFVVAQEGDPVF